MPTKYPAQIDNSASLPPVTDNLTPVGAKEVNALRDAIISIQSELGTKPSGTSSTVKNRLTELETMFDGSGSGGIGLSGDLGGTYSNIKVIGIQGVPVGSAAPTNGQVLQFNGTSYVPTTAASTATDATTSLKGIIQLAGNLAGTASSPIVTGIRAVTVNGTAPTNGQVLTATSESTAAWATPSGTVADATTSVKGIIQLATDLGGTSTAPTVVALTGASGSLPIKCAEITNSSVTNMVVKDKNFYIQTTNATPTTLATLATTSNTAFQVDAIIVGNKSDHTQAGTYKRSMLVRNVAGTLTMVGSVDNLDQKEDNAAWDATLTFSGTNVLCTVTGAATTTINWVGRISTIQVS